MKVMKWRIGKQKSRRAPVGAGLAIGLGGALVAWGYRRWARKSGSGRPAAAEGAGALSQGRPQGAGEPGPDAARLQEHFHGLDQDARTGDIPRDLERDPKNIEQTRHSG